MFELLLYAQQVLRLFLSSDDALHQQEIDRKIEPLLFVRQFRKAQAMSLTAGVVC